MSTKTRIAIFWSYKNNQVSLHIWGNTHAACATRRELEQLRLSRLTWWTSANELSLGRPHYKETKKKADCENCEDGASNMETAVEFSTNLLRSGDSSYVLYPWISLCVASCPLFRGNYVLVNHSWSCVAVLWDGVHIACSQRTRIQIVSQPNRHEMFFFSLLLQWWDYLQ